MTKILFYAMTGEKMCFQHVLMNAVDLAAAGVEVKLIFEGASVKLLPILETENNPIYRKARELDLIAGICLACSKALGVYDEVKDLGLPMLEDMFGHAGMKPYVQDGYSVISM